MTQPIWFLAMRWPATACSLVLIVMYVLLAPLDLEYDDNGLGSFLFVVNPVLGFPFLAAGDALYSLNGNQWLRYHALCTILLGFLFYVLCDLLLQLLRGVFKTFAEQ